MSYNKIKVVVYIIGVLICSSCEDKQSKKDETTPPEKNTQIKSTTTTPSKSLDTIEAPIETSISESFRLTNENAIEFLSAYGKENPETQVRITTTFGDIDIELYHETSLYRANFIYLVKQKYFDQTFFYRVAKDFLIQGGNSDRKECSAKRKEIGKYGIPQHQLPSLTHTRGSLSAAKRWKNNESDHSHPYEFFIIVNSKVSHHLDGEHTIFGRVIKGMDVVDEISNVPVDESEWPLQNVFIKTIVL